MSAESTQRLLYRDLHAAAPEDRAKAAAEALKADPKPGGWTLLHEAVKRQNDPLVKALIEAGADIHARDRYQWTPLHEICSDCGYRVISVDLIRGERLPPIIDPPGDVVLSLLNGGADPEAEDEFGETPLHWAKFWKRQDLIEILQAPEPEPPGAEAGMAMAG